MEYDKKIVEKHRKHAVTDTTKLVEGNIYYFYDIGKQVVVEKIAKFLTNAEVADMLGVPYEGKIPHNLRVFRNGSGQLRYLSDYHVTASCSPWMIFDDLNRAHTYAQEITPTIRLGL